MLKSQINVLEILKGLPNTNITEVKDDKPVNLFRIKFENELEVDISIIRIEKDTVPINVTNSVIGFQAEHSISSWGCSLVS